MCVVQLSGTSKLSVSANGRVETTEVGEGGGKGETIEDLGDTGSRLMGFALVTPVTSGKGVLEAVCDGPGLDGQLQVEVLGLQ